KAAAAHSDLAITACRTPPQAAGGSPRAKISPRTRVRPYRRVGTQWSRRAGSTGLPYPEAGRRSKPDDGSRDRPGYWCDRRKPRRFFPERRKIVQVADHTGRGRMSRRARMGEGDQTTPQPEGTEIGRASCRERGWSGGGAVGGRGKRR